MVSLNEETIIPAPPSKVWPLLSDPEVVASCIPGAELAPASDDGLWRGSVRVKFGPTVVTFRGEAALTFDDDAQTCTIEGRGIDQRGASRALASGTMVATGETETRLAIDGEFNVTGPLEGFANAGGVHVARALLAEFSENLAKVVSDSGDAAEPAAPEAEEPVVAAAPSAAAEPQPTPEPSAAKQSAGELSASGLLWRIIKSKISQIFGKKG
ncbi:SRPBCC family protein [Alphaproteobacteria bacterium]|nr:SRPBCC family protein [Alphaproteobacteria bacterium]